jgi:putative transposase
MPLIHFVLMPPFASMYLHPVMPLRSKTSYHPHLLIAFYLHSLPTDWLNRIPWSTRHEWSHKDQTALYGYDWAMQNQSLFDTLREVSTSRKLLRINRALLRIIALKRFIARHHARLTENIPPVRDVVLHTIYKITTALPLKSVLKYLQQSYSWYLQLQKKQRCRSSLFSLCRIKHPGQLLLKEIHVIKSYCSDMQFLHWPLASVYHQILRDRVAAFNISTFYKYVSLLGLKRKGPAHRRKNHQTGIRASAPLQLLHADMTIFRTADNKKHYIYLVQDNYSRAILSYRVADSCKAQLTFENLHEVLRNYLIPSGVSSCTLLTDDGSENAGPVKKWISGSLHPSLTHLIAQRDIEFSNSMIEAANKQLKYRFLYHHHIADGEALNSYIQQAVQEYNNRPHDVLNGLTPLEVLHGQPFDQQAARQQMVLSQKNRIEQNKVSKCCFYSF